LLICIKDRCVTGYYRGATEFDPLGETAMRRGKMSQIFDNALVGRLLVAGAIGWGILFLASESDIVAGKQESAMPTRQPGTITATIEQWIWETRSCFGCYSLDDDNVAAWSATRAPAAGYQRAVPLRSR
jgi:hypothetical protein